MKYSELKDMVISNFPLFISNVSSQIYVNANKLVVGTYLGMNALASYDIADRLIGMIKVPLTVIGQVLFPKLSRDRDLNYIKQVMYFVLSVYIILDINC